VGIAALPVPEIVDKAWHGHDDFPPIPVAAADCMCVTYGSHILHVPVGRL
jgi:hypothetical protein